MATSAGMVGGLPSLLFYLAVYGVTTLGVFALIASLSRPDRPLETSDDLAGHALTRPGSEDILRMPCALARERTTLTRSSATLAGEIFFPALIQHNHANEDPHSARNLRRPRHCASDRRMSTTAEGSAP